MATQNRSFRWVRNWYLLRRTGNSFIGSQWGAGVALVLFAIIALVLANTEATKHAYHHILEMNVGIAIGEFGLNLSVEQWINDALMVIFFFVVGIEIKRELKVGQLSNIRQASLPIAAAIGGMIVPALIYTIVNKGTAFEAGWGIPMATDIAFAIGVLSLLGNRVPMSLKVFLTALAIVDDLGAILVIAIFYTSQINFVMLGVAIGIVALMFYMNRLGVKSTLMYLIPGVVVWYLFLNSGVHATISGVLVAMAIPTKPRFTKKYFLYKVRYFLEEFKFYDKENKEVLTNHDQHHALSKINMISKATVSPAQRLEHSLNPIVMFLIMPIFALANAGVELSSVSDLKIFASEQGTGIFLGLVAGKAIGITLFCWLAIKTGIAVMPKLANWTSLFGVACLGGIGFTMSIFIANLAFAGTGFVDSAKIAILIASISAALLGVLVINLFAKKVPSQEEK